MSSESIRISKYLPSNKEGGVSVPLRDVETKGKEEAVVSGKVINVSFSATAKFNTEPTYRIQFQKTHST